ncbi:hypothetical protein Tco_0044016, partial [Tanacetum coccineum]
APVVIVLEFASVVVPEFASAIVPEFASLFQIVMLFVCFPLAIFLSTGS